MIEELRSFMKRTGLTQAQIARSLGKSAGQMSQYLGGYYKGNIENLEKDLKNFMDSYNKKDEQKSEDFKIVETVNLKTTHFICDEAIIGNEMAVIVGDAGSGKTEALKAYLERNPASIFIESVPGMQFRAVLKNLAKKVGITTGSKNPEEIIREIAKDLKNRETVLIIDEAENLTTKMLEAIRRIWDFSKVPTVLVGTPALLNNLKGRNGELLQLYSRISGKYEFMALNDEDWNTLFGEFAEDIKKTTKHLRRAVSVYKKAIRFARLNNEELNAGHIKAASNMVILD